MPGGRRVLNRLAGSLGRHGTWRSLVAHLLWEQGVAGSNPVVPTTPPSRCGHPPAATSVTAVSARAGQKSTQCFAGRSSIGSFTVGNACRHIRLDRDPVDSGAHLIGAAAAGLRSVRFNGSGSALGATCAAVLCVMRRCCV